MIISSWRNRLAVVCLLVTMVMIVLVDRCHAARIQEAGRPVVLAHYMPWFEAKPGIRQWGWHWTMNTFDPERVIDGKRTIASHYYPLIGPYDSGDPDVIEYHLLLMKLAGVDGIVVDWYGLSDLYDYPVVHRNTRALFEHAEKMGMKVAICYEDQTIPTLIEQKRISASDRVMHAKGDLAWMQANWFSRPAYLKLQGRPVLLSFGYSGLTDGEWEQVLRSMSAPPLYLSEHRRRTGANGSFDWPQPQTGLASVDTYYQARQGDAVQMPVAFPRFHDIYKQAKVHESYGEIPDNAGKTFTTTLERALKSGAALVQIATWNDWGEGTGIEPTKEYGYRDLETILMLRRLSGVSTDCSADDLRLPYRLWVLRRRQSLTPALKADLESIASMLSSGKASAARSALVRLEAKVH